MHVVVNNELQYDNIAKDIEVHEGRECFDDQKEEKDRIGQI